MRDIEAARDLLQDTLAKAWQRCGCYRGESELFPWLKAALRRGAIDRLRSQRAQTALHDDKGNNWREVESALRDNQNAAWHEPLPQLQQREREAVFKRCASVLPPMSRGLSN